jgi:hypothetical protein
MVPTMVSPYSFCVSIFPNTYAGLIPFWGLDYPLIRDWNHQRGRKLASLEISNTPHWSIPLPGCQCAWPGPLELGQRAMSDGGRRSHRSRTSRAPTLITRLAKPRLDASIRRRRLTHHHIRPRDITPGAGAAAGDQCCHVWIRYQPHTPILGPIPATPFENSRLYSLHHMSMKCGRLADLAQFVVANSICDIHMERLRILVSLALCPGVSRAGTSLRRHA